MRLTSIRISSNSFFSLFFSVPRPFQSSITPLLAGTDFSMACLTIFSSRFSSRCFGHTWLIASLSSMALAKFGQWCMPPIPTNVSGFGVPSMFFIASIMVEATILPAFSSL